MDAMGGCFSDTERRGGFGNPLKVTHESGARVFFGAPPERPQPVVVDASGEVCETWADQLIGWSHVLGGAITRVDLAVDLKPDELARRRMLEMKRAWVREKVDTLMRVDSLEEHKNKDGLTFYFGGRTAELRLRTYDQRGPLRLEFQWRPEKEVGRFVPKMITSGGGVTPVWRALASRVRFPMRWYQELLEGDVAAVSPAVQPGETELAKFIDQLMVQYGPSLWALQQIGFDLGNLAVAPEKPKGEVVAKFMRWAEEAPSVGYDGEKLKAEVRWLVSKSKRA